MRRLLVALVLGGLPLSCGPRDGRTEVPADAATTVVSLQGIDCGSCGTKMVEDLSVRPDVYAATFDVETAEVSIQHPPGGLDVAAVLELAQTHGFTAVEGAGQGSYVPETAFPPGLDVKKIAEAGEAVRLEDHLVDGKVTVFDFYALWCKPCRAVDAHMQQVLATQPDVALRKLDVVDWDSELAKRYLGGVPGLPYLVVYGKNGQRVATISGLHLDELDAAIGEARG